MKTIKEMFQEKINEEDIKKQIRNKITRQKSHTYSWKWKIATICLVLFLGIPIVTTNKTQNQSNNEFRKTENQKIIKWNHSKKNEKPNDIGWDGKVKTIKEFSNDYPWLKNIQIPEGYTLEKSEMVYGLSDHEYHGNVLLYRTEESYIRIYFSNLDSELSRCFSSNSLEELEKSNINNIDMRLIEVERENQKLMEYQKENYQDYYAFFQKDGINFDIEIGNGNRNDFIKLLESITY